MNYYSTVAIACSQLDPGVQWAGKAWADACWRVGHQFRADLPARRTAEEQHALWQKGRNKPGKRVTNADGYKVRSEHQDGLAMDVYPVNCTYQQLAEIAVQFGISHPWPKSLAHKNKGFIDEPHFSFALVKREPPPHSKTVDPDAVRRGLERRIKNEPNPARRKRMLDRLNRSTSIPPTV